VGLIASADIQLISVPLRRAVCNGNERLLRASLVVPVVFLLIPRLCTCGKISGGKSRLPELCGSLRGFAVRLDQLCLLDMQLPISRARGRKEGRKHKIQDQAMGRKAEKKEEQGTREALISVHLGQRP
jgi:hypothetical protein